LIEEVATDPQHAIVHYESWRRLRETVLEGGSA
jgi:hypothetical protein